MQLIPRETRDHVWRRAARRPIALAAAVLCTMSTAAVGTASAAVSGGHSQAPAAGGAAYNWATFHRTGNLQGWASNSSVTTANASKLGVKWAANIYGAAVDSPVVAYDSALHARLAYIGTQNDDMLAVDLGTGKIVWSVNVGAQVRSSPLVVNGSVFLATANSSKIFKLNATTGAMGCTFTSPRQIEGSPVAATPPGGVPTVYFGANDTSVSGPLYALKQSDCSKEWAFTGYASVTGSWDPLAYAVDAKGEPLILFGTSDTDSKVYAIDAVTGKKVWRYAVYNPAPHIYDVGAGVTVTAPGVNGFADGMAYVASKYGIMYGLNLTTGKKVWSDNYNKQIKSFGRNISTAALSGTNLVVGDANGLVDLNAVTGKVVWHNDNPADTGVDSSPAIAGPAGSQVVAVGDLAGGFDVDSLATGAALYHYQTGQYITGSPAVSGGDIVIASADGFLYDFAIGGGNESTPPSASVTSPVDSSQIANPNGNLTVTGSAADQAGIARVDVAVQENGQGGNWWDAATGKWVAGPVPNPATVASPGSTSSNWAFSYPVPASGGTYQVTADTVSTRGQSSPSAGSSFTVEPSTTSPQVKVQNVFAPPGGQTTVSGTGFGDSETAAISLNGTQLGTAQTTASGDLPSTPVTIPTDTPFGLTALTVTGQTSAKTGTAGITVANQWAEEGHDGVHSGYEPYDPDILDSIAAGNGTYLNLAWAFGAGAAVSAPPVVGDTVAYVPTANGKLKAVDVHSGTSLWTWALPSGAALNAPAIDTGYSRVFVGASDGTLSAVSTNTGKTIWSDSLGSNVFGPVLGTGKIYVATSAGVVEAISEGSGKKVWSKTLGHPVTGAPALDPTAKMLFVGESNGDVKELSLSGTVQWTHSTGSAAVATPPVVGGGDVYVGAGDSMYALNESTGAADWSYTTGGKISSTFTRNDTGAHKGVIITVGSADGYLYGLTATAGKDDYKIHIGYPITGVASSYQTYLFDTSVGVVGGGRITSGERLWERTTTGGAMTSPVVVDGTVYAGGADSELYAYTTYGQPPA
jgi:outer membrane protein assembly factor BamB